MNERAVIDDPQSVGWGANPLVVVQEYLPRGWEAYWKDGTIIIAGEDNAGWTLKDYVLPRLASGMIYARELET